MPDMSQQLTDKLLARYPIISDQVDAAELRVILDELALALQRDPAGSVVELGCYIGTTSLFVRRLMNELGSHGEFHVYDSFAGLPDKSSRDRSPAGEQFRTGELFVSKRDFITQFKKAGLQLPVIHRGWFADLTSDDIPRGIIFAFLDGDYYESICDSFRVITPHLAQGAVIIIDDYASESLPGVAHAVDEWLRVHPAKIKVKASLAIIHL